MATSESVGFTLLIEMGGRFWTCGTLIGSLRTEADDEDDEDDDDDDEEDNKEDEEAGDEKDNARDSFFCP